MSLLFRNALKGLKKKKIQMCSIIIMIMLSTAIFTAMNTSLDRIEDRYYNYLNEQKVEDVVFNPLIQYDKDISLDELTYLKNNYFKDITLEEKTLLTQYESYLKSGLDITLGLKLQLDNLFVKYDVTDYLYTKKLDMIKDKYDFIYQKELSKNYKEDKVSFKIIPYIEDKQINKAYLIEGKFPKNDNEVTILPGFAKKHKLKIGDNYTINKNKYKIVGFTYAPNYIYPLISYNSPIFNEENNNIVFMNENTYNAFLGTSEDTYALKYNYDTTKYLKFDAKTSIDDNPLFKIFKEEKDTIGMSTGTMASRGRISSLQMEITTDRLFAEYFLYLLLGISAFIIMIITKKRIDDERLQIGVLKSLGYSRFSIAISYLVYPIVGSIIGGILGYAIGIGLNGILANMFISYFNVPLTGFKFSLKYLVLSVLVPIILLSILSYLIAIFMLRKKPLQLLKEGSNLKVNFFSKLISKITSFLPFNYRFKYALASRSLGKLFVVSLTSFCTGLLIVLTLIGSNMFTSMIDKTFDAMSYKYGVSFNNVRFEQEMDPDDDYILGASFKLLEVKDSKGKNKDIDDDKNISITGVDKKRNYLDIVNSKNKDIFSDISNDEVIINANMKEVLNIDVGDTIVIGDGEKLEISYVVKDISESYMDFTSYVTRESLSNKLGLPQVAYNGIYSNNSKYKDVSKIDPQIAKSIAYVFSFDDLKDNVYSQVKTFNSSIYVVIGFASFMALVIIAVIANIIVEENKKTISLMKVMGYKNKEISSIVLNIYTPFVIIAYLLSIPVMIYILKAIVKALIGDMNMALPISLSPVGAAIGLVFLLIAYYIAIFFSRKILNKIPLAIALKRE